MNIIHKEYYGDLAYLRIANEPCLESDMVSFFHALGFPEDELLKADIWYGDLEDIDLELDSVKYQAFLVITKRYVHVMIVIKTKLKTEIEHLVRDITKDPNWGKPKSG